MEQFMKINTAVNGFPSVGIGELGCHNNLIVLSEIMQLHVMTVIIRVPNEHAVDQQMQWALRFKIETDVGETCIEDQTRL